MSNTLRYINYADSRSLSKLVLDYTKQIPALAPLYQFPYELNSIEKAIAEKRKQNIDRQLLHKVLLKQYDGLELSAKVKQNIDRLKDEQTFSICAAHQPNIFSGYLYVVYKILQACKMSDELNTRFNSYNFVPVFYIGSEDADIDEIGSVNLYEQSFKWKPTQTGAVGRMSCAAIQDLLNEFIAGINTNSENGKQLAHCLKSAYTPDKTIAQAFKHFINALLGEYGIVLVDGDDPELKAVFKEVIIDELASQQAAKASQHAKSILEKDYALQAKGRDINLFYLDEQVRNRIEKLDDNYIVHDTKISFTKNEILALASAAPEKFSPNVMLRALYQEMILPNIMFIGGGGELAYWLELKGIFEHYRIPYPIVALRQSFLWITKKQEAQLAKHNLDLTLLFKNDDEISKHLVFEAGLNFDTNTHALQELQKSWQAIAEQHHLNMADSLAAHFAKFERIQTQLKQKTIRLYKKKETLQLNQALKLKKQLFPRNNLQERVDNFIPYYLEMGIDFFKSSYESMLLFDNRFAVLTY